MVHWIISHGTTHEVRRLEAFTETEHDKILSGSQLHNFRAGVHFCSGLKWLFTTEDFIVYVLQQYLSAWWHKYNKSNMFVFSSYLSQSTQRTTLQQMLSTCPTFLKTGIHQLRVPASVLATVCSVLCFISSKLCGLFDYTSSLRNLHIKIWWGKVGDSGGQRPHPTICSPYIFQWLP
jgi:hypothetical protein